MERIVGIALTRYLATYIKDFSAQKFQNWALNDLEFNEEVIQNLVGIPPQLRVKKVTCNQIYTKIPWKKLGHDPIVFVADKIYIELEEPEEIKPAPKKIPKSLQPKKKAPGFTDRILDNIKFEVHELTFKVITLGKHRKDKERSKPPALFLHVKDILIQSTNAKWEAVDLKEVHKVNHNNQVLIFKEIHLGQVSLSLHNDDNRVPMAVLDKIPIRVRIKTKKEYFGGPLVDFQIDVDLLSDIALKLDPTQYNDLQKAIYGTLNCLSRQPKQAPVDTASKAEENGHTNTANNNTNNIRDDISETSEADVSEHETHQPQTQQQAGVWGRLTNRLWSYYSTKNQPEPIPATPVTAVESVAEPDSNSDSDAEYQDAESGSEEDLPDEEATVADDEDIRYTSYNIHIHKGTLELFERLNRDASAENKDAPNKGLCSLRFDGLKCSFFPKMRGDYQDQGQWITQSEAHIKINSYSLTVLDPGPSRHPDYLQLIKFDTGSHNNTHENMGGLHTEVKVKAPMLNLNFIKRHIPTTIRRPEVTIFSRELELSFNNCAIIFDKEIWERTYNFFLSGRKGKQLQRTLEQGMENMLQVALRDYVKFKIESKNPTIILPPYAGHKGPPHIASQVMRLNVGYVSMSNNDPTYPTPEAFTGGLFVLPAPHFPAAPYDFSSHIGQEKLVSAQKFQVETTNLSVDLQATPESRIERVLQPFNLVVNISLNDYLHSPKFTPNFELFVQVSRVNFAINPAQYKYFTSVFSERLSWSPGALLNENKALEHQSDELNNNNTNAIEPIPASPVQEESPFLSCFKVKIDRGLIQLNEVVPNSDPKSHDLHYSTLAEIEFQNIAVILESQATKNAIKVQLDTFNIQCPQHIKSPFPMLLSPLNTAQNSRIPMLVVRYESVKLKPGDKPLAADVKAKINHVQICLIYSTLSKLQSFLTSDDLKITVDTEKFKQFLSKYSNVENVAMNWSVDFTASEALVVESPDTPECAPAILHHVSISKFGIDDLNVKYNFSGRLAFASIMWEQTHFHREDISQPCNVALEYLSTRENTQDDGTNHVTMTIDDLTASLSRTQFIFMQTIVDNLFTDIRDVSTKRDEGKIIKIDTRKRLRARYQINVRASHLTLRQGKKNLALVRIDRFSYTYENWTHKFRTLIEGDALVIEDLSAERTQFKTLVQPRHIASSASSEELNDNEADTEDEDDGAGVLINEPNNNNHQPPVQKKKRKKRRLPKQLRMIIDPTRADEEDHSGVELTESPGTMRQNLTTSSLEQIKRIADKADRDELNDKDPLFRLCFESKNKEFIAARINEGLSIDHLHDEEPQSDREDEDDGAWSTSWVIDIAQLEVVYVPETFGQLKEFFSLVGEHKNLRRQYQKIQAEILSLYQKEDYSNVFKETQQEMIKRASQRVDMSGPGPVNAVDSVPKSEAQQLRLKINISQPVVLLPEKLTESITSVLEVTLRAVQIGNNTANKTQITVQHATVRLKRIQTLGIDQSSRVLQSLDVLKPLTCEVNIYSRPNFVHIETIIDTFAGVISLQKYQTSIGIVQQYVEQFMKSLQSDPNSSIEPANKGPFVDKVIELSVRSVNLTIVSDYVAELELFYLYFKGVDVTANMYEEFTEVNMSAKFEAMVNNLSFMMPEQFIDDMHFAVKARLSNKITELDDAEPVSDYESASSAQLDYLTIDNGAGVLIDEEVGESPQMSSRPSFNGSLHDTERRTKKQSRLSLEVVVLDKVIVRVTKELLRHLIEIYQLYLNHRSDDHSHFQYILSNKTESQALYHQAKTADIKVLAPGEEASFNFTNPYLPKLLSIKLNGWQQTNKALAVDEPSSSVMTIQQENNPQLTRDIIVNVKPKGLKRYVELIASHQVHNETDLCLELMTWWSDKNLPTQTYTIEPSKSVPICCSQLWEMQFAVRCNDNIDWDFSDNFVMPSIRRFRDRDVTQKLTITSVDQSTKRVLFMTYISDTTNPNLVRINFSAPFIIQNLSVFPLDCDFPHNRRFDMTIPANSQQAFYFDPAQPNQTVAFKLEGYDRYSRPIPVHYLQRTTVENKRDVHRDQDKSLVYLNVFNQHRLASREARTMYVNTKYLLINETDLPLFVRQRGTREEVAILPHTKAPFSWLKFGARQLQVKVADTAWSRAINISQPSVNRINITIKDIHLSYDLMMEVKQLDAFSRVVIWRSRLHFTNQTNRDLVIRFNSGTEGARTNTLLLKKNSLVDSAIAPAGLELSVSQQQPSRDNGPALSYEEWDYVPFKIDKVGRFTKKINNLTSYKQYFIADIAVEKDEKGVYICFTENVTPPYLIYNNTPFNLKLRPALFNAPALNMNGVQDEEHEHEYRDKNDKVPLLGPPSSGGHRRSRSEGGTSPALNAGPDGLLNPAPLIVVEPRGSAEWYDDGLTQHDKSAEEAAQERKKKKRQRRGSSLLNTLMFQAALELANEGSALTPRSRANGSGHTSDAGGEDSLLLDDESFSDIEHESGNNTNVFQPGHSRNNSSGSIKRGTTLARSGEVINITPSSSLRRSRQVPQPGQYSTPPARRSTPAKHERTLSSSALVPQLNLRQSVQTRRSQIDKYTSLLTERGNQWSQPFNIERLGEFVVQFDELDDSTAPPLSERSTASSKISMGNHRHAEDEDKHEHGQSLLLSVITRGNTKILTFSLPTRKEDGSVAPLNTATEVLRVNLRVPQFDICIMDQSSTQEALYTTITEINMELSKMSSYQYYVYLTVHELEIDTMFKTAEYPVLFTTDRRTLHSIKPNLLEALVEWSVRDKHTIVQYLGARLLPLFLQLDGDALDAIMQLKGYLNPKADNVAEDDEQARMKAMLQNYNVTNMNLDHFLTQAANNNAIYVDKIDIFPLDITISIGANNYYLPVISEARLSLPSFQRSSLYHTMASLMQFIASSYFKFVWTELYQIIGNMDVIASPIQNARKLFMGFKDFFLMPVESLVLDDTPGAFLFGAARGTRSLLLNLADFVFTTLMKLINAISWLVHWGTLDDQYLDIKARVNRRHPVDALDGLIQGGTELLRGLWGAASSVCLVSYRGAQEEGVTGFFQGLGAGTLGVVLKPIGGVLDFTSKIFEGVLQSLGRGNLMLTRSHQQRKPLTGPQANEEEVIDRWLKDNNEKLFAQDRVKVINHYGRVSDRVLLLTLKSMYILSVPKLTRPEYMPKSIPTNDILEVIVPTTPETTFIVHSKVPLYGQTKFLFIAPDRDLFINKLTLFFNVPAKPQNFEESP